VRSLRQDGWKRRAHVAAREELQWNCAPLKDLSSSQEIRVATDIGIAFGKDVKVALIDRWGDLDDKSRAIVVERTNAAGVQIISTVVGTHDPDITVTIEDGRVDGDEGEP